MAVFLFLIAFFNVCAINEELTNDDVAVDSSSPEVLGG